MNQENIGKFIASLRKEKGMTQEQLAELVEGKRSETKSYFLKEASYRENYDILMEVNRKEIAGEDFTDKEKQEIVELLLNGSASKEDVKKYKLRMRVNPVTDNIYPNYFIPPYNGDKKLPMINGKLPKTHILYANHYELELLRILFLFAPENEAVQEMIKNTLHRLKNTCYGNNCPQGECVTTGKVVLRFLQTVCPEEKDWIEKLEAPAMCCMK